MAELNKQKLITAIKEARDLIGRDFDPSDDRVLAYQKLAKVYKDVDPDAYGQIVLQMQITSYSGKIGGAAILGNYVAATNNPVKYTDSLDKFSWDILDQTIRGHERMIELHEQKKAPLSTFTQKELQLLDFSVWDEKGMGGSFPGNAQLINDYAVGIDANDLHPSIGDIIGDKYPTFNDLTGDYITASPVIGVQAENVGTKLSDFGFNATLDYYLSNIDSKNFTKDGYSLQKALGGDTLNIIHEATG